MKQHLFLVALSFINHGGTLPTKSLGRFLNSHTCSPIFVEYYIRQIHLPETEEINEFYEITLLWYDITKRNRRN